MGSPLISVIIPSFNKATELEISLPLLRAQTCNLSNWQLIVIDDGSTDATCEVVKKHAGKRDLTLVSLDPATRRVSRARNVGADCATAPYILFLDPDILPSPSLIEEHLTQVSVQDHIVSLGYMYAVGIGQDVFQSKYGTEWDFSNINSTIYEASKLSDLYDARWEWADAPDFFASLPCPWAGGWTGNLALSRRAFFDVGGFDESFVDRGMEDIDFSYRLYKAGIDFKLNENAVGFHYPHPKNHARAGESDAKNSFTLLKKYPQIEIEIMKVVSCSQLNEVVPFIQQILITNTCAASLDLSRVFAALGGRKLKICIAGSYPNSIAGIPEDALSTSVKFTGLTETENGDKNNLPLLGIATPFESGSFDVAIVVDSWVNLPLPLAAIQLEELKRISSIVVACSTSSGDLSARLRECEIEFKFTPLTDSSSLKTFTVETRKPPRYHQELFLNRIPLNVEDRGTARVWEVSS